MTRISAIDHETATGKAKELLDGVKARLGFAPNLMKTFANSPEALGAYLGFSDTLGKTLNAKLREQIALVVAEENGCGYCRSAHTAIGKMVGLSEEDTIDARTGNAPDARASAALKFVKAVLADRGKVSGEELIEIRSAGFSDGEIVEMIANVALNVLTNYLNNVAETDIDFPLAPPLTRSVTV